MKTGLFVDTCVNICTKMTVKSKLKAESTDEKLKGLVYQSSWKRPWLSTKGLDTVRHLSQKLNWAATVCC